MNIGEKLKKIRKIRDLTLDDIAQKSKIGKATLSRIENNITAGTLRTHMKVCEALGLNLKDLYEGIDLPKEEVSTVDEKNSKEAEVFSYDEKAKSIILTKNAQKNNMLPQLLILEIDGKTHLEQNIPGTEKFIFCIDGSIQINIEDKTYDLKKGNSLYFKSSLSHRFVNIGKKPAKCLVITSPVSL
jgi:transcriptional regulator with XRE-family HTH domain